MATPDSGVCGIALLDKPLGLSSHQATQRVRRLFAVDKAGHIGSLDPLASGMLPVCLGEATKVAGVVVDGLKQYTFRIALGGRTATGDAEGPVVESCAVPAITPADLDQVLAAFVGELEQVPPMYSALKRDGRPLYQLARAGIEVDRPARRIFIQSLSGRVLGADLLECCVRCGKGTYVRVLAEDIARALGTCGHVVLLRRDWVEPFQARQMLTLLQLEQLPRGELGTVLLAADQALPALPQIVLEGEEARRVQSGQRAFHAGMPAGLVRLYGPAGRFLGLGQGDGADGVRAKRLFVSAL